MTTVSKYTTGGDAGAEVHARVVRLMAAKAGTYQQAVLAEVKL